MQLVGRRCVFSTDTGWLMKQVLNIEYRSTNSGGSFTYLAANDGNPRRIIGHVFQFSNDRLRFMAAETVLFDHLVTQSWSDDEHAVFMIKFDSAWYRLDDDEEWELRDLNPDRLVTPPAIMILLKNIDGPFRKVIVSPMGITTMEV